MNIRDVEKVCNMFKKLLRTRPDICPHEYHRLKSYGHEGNLTEVHYECKWCGNYKVQVVHHKPRKTEVPSDDE